MNELARSRPPARPFTPTPDVGAAHSVSQKNINTRPDVAGVLFRGKRGIAAITATVLGLTGCTANETKPADIECEAQAQVWPGSNSATVTVGTKGSPDATVATFQSPEGSGQPETWHQVFPAPDSLLSPRIPFDTRFMPDGQTLTLSILDGVAEVEQAYTTVEDPRASAENPASVVTKVCGTWVVNRYNGFVDLTPITQ